MSPEFAAVVAGEVCGYRLLGMLLRPGRPTDAEAKELAKTQTAALREPTGGPGKAQTSGSIDSQPKERTESTLSARPAEHLAVLCHRPQSADARRRGATRRTTCRRPAPRRARRRGAHLLYEASVSRSP